MTKNNDKRITVRDFFDLLTVYGDQWSRWEVNDFTDSGDCNWQVKDGNNYCEVAAFIEKHSDHIITDMRIDDDGVLCANVNPDE